MMRSEYPYIISQELNFGKYKDLSVQMVFAGSEESPLFWTESIIKDYFYSDVELDDVPNRTENFDKVKFRFNESSFLGSYGKQALIPLPADAVGTGRACGIMVNKGASLYERLEKLFEKARCENYNKNVYHEIIEIWSKYDSDADPKRIILSGNPKYLEWVIMNTDMLFLSPEDLIQLEQSKVNRWQGFTLNDKAFVNAFEIIPVIEKVEFKFSNAVHERNAMLFNRFMKKKGIL